MKAFQVLLYYQFVAIEDHEQFVADHLALCRSLGLLGRILVAPEGINGTVSGTVEACQAYMDALHADPRFANMPFKIDEADGHVFQKLFVRARPEIIALGGEVNMERRGGYLKPAEFLKAMEEPGVIILDGRNNYESDMGHFEGALCPDVRNFRDFREWILEHLSAHRSDRILTYCTGGIRCEKLTAWMVQEGFEDVWQLDGGIVTYGYDDEAKGARFDGSCYVFDDRVGVPINRSGGAKVLTKCYHCGVESERFVNCANVECNLLHAVCSDCEARMDCCCSEQCMASPFQRIGPGRLAKKAELPARRSASRRFSAVRGSAGG